MTKSENFFANKNVLITGGAGFIGTNLIKRLISLGANIRATTYNNRPVILDNKIEYIKCDLLNKNDCQKVVKGMDFVFHCAAVTHGAAEIKANPVSMVTPNIIMNSQLLEESWKAGAKKFIFISSNAAYPPTGNDPVKEHEMFLDDPYDIYMGVGWMKRYTEKLCQFYNDLPRPKHNKMSTVVVRPCFIKGTKILMADGITENNIEDIKVGDNVLTHKNRIRKVINISKQTYSGNLITLVSTGLEPVTCTEDHPFYSIKSEDMLCTERDDNRFCHLDNELIKYCNEYESNFRIDKNQTTLFTFYDDNENNNNNSEYFPNCTKRIKPKWINAKNLNLFDMTSYLVPNIKIKDIEKIDILNYVNKNSIPDIVYDDNFISYGNFNHSRRIPRYIKLDNDMLTLLGYFLAEGSYVKKGRDRKKGDNNDYIGIGFKFHIKEIDYIRTVVSIIIKKFRIKPYITRDEDCNSCGVRITNKIIANLFLTLCGEYSQHKKIHNDLMLLPNEKLRYLMKALLNGDCWKNKEGRKGLTLQSDVLNKQLWNISNRLMMFPSIYIFDQKKWNEKHPYQHRFSDEKEKIRLAFNTGSQQRHIRYLKDNIIFSKIRHIEKTKSECIVYNLDIEEDNSYCANGYIVHNCNIYGPNDDFDFATSHVTAATIRKVIERHNPIEVWGDGNDIRDIIYIDDFIEGLILATEKLDIFNPINIAFGKGYSVKQILQIAIEIEGFNDAQIIYNSSKPSMIPIRLIDISKAERLLKFKAKIDIKEGIKKTIYWYRENY